MFRVERKGGNMSKLVGWTEEAKRERRELGTHATSGLWAICSKVHELVAEEVC